MMVSRISYCDGHSRVRLTCSCLQDRMPRSQPCGCWTDKIKPINLEHRSSTFIETSYCPWKIGGRCVSVRARRRVRPSGPWGSALLQVGQRTIYVTIGQGSSMALCHFLNCTEFL